jgi:lipopolysaccharide transport system ATP-binding protein
MRQVTSPPLAALDVEAPPGAVIGIVGETGAGKRTLGRLAAGLERPVSGAVEAPEPRRFTGPDDSLDLSPAGLLVLYHALARRDLLARERAAVEVARLVRGGAIVLLVSHEEELLRRLSDEVWWLDRGKLAGRGDPAEVLRAYRCHVAGQFRAWGQARIPPLDPRLRRGDGRAEILSLEMLGESGQPTTAWRSGELAVVRVTVRYREPVADPVIGVLIRTRIGLNVYGTNTELEQMRLGPCASGDTLRLTFGFRCELCPEAYTLTVASHDRDGTWHDWLEDAVAFSVTDTRYTAGVANLRARVTVERV